MNVEDLKVGDYVRVVSKEYLDENIPQNKNGSYVFENEWAARSGY